MKLKINSCVPYLIDRLSDATATWSQAHSLGPSHTLQHFVTDVIFGELVVFIIREVWVATLPDCRELMV